MPDHARFSASGVGFQTVYCTQVEEAVESWRRHLARQIAQPPFTRPPLASPIVADGAFVRDKAIDTACFGSGRPHQAASANRLRQHGHSPSFPLRMVENALGCGSVMIARKASGARCA